MFSYWWLAAGKEVYLWRRRSGGNVRRGGCDV